MPNKQTKKTVLRCILSSFLVLVAVMVQTTVLPYFRLFGAVPNITLALLVILGVFEDERFICVLAVCGGFVLQCIGSSNLSYYALTFLLAVCVSIVLSRRALGSAFVCSLISGTVAFICDGAMTAAIILISDSSASLFQVLWHTCAPQLLYSFICLVILYPPCKLYMSKTYKKILNK